MGQVSIIDNFFPQERSQKLEPYYIAPGLCYAEKNGCFFQNLHSMFSQFNRVIFDTSFSQDNMKNLPNKIGPENFLYFIVSERSSSLWWRNDILSRTDFSYLFLFFLLSSFFFHTDKNDYYHEQLTSSGIHMNEQERERHIKQNKICEGCFSHVQTLTSLVRWLNKFFSFNASLV